MADEKLNFTTYTQFSFCYYISIVSEGLSALQTPTKCIIYMYMYCYLCEWERWTKFYAVIPEATQAERLSIVHFYLHFLFEQEINYWWFPTYSTLPHFLKPLAPQINSPP